MPTGFQHQQAIQAGASYDFTILRVYGQVGRVETDATVEDQANIYQLGIAVPIGTSLILASYGNSHAKSSVRTATDKIASIAYDYFLSKNTDIYVAAMYEKLTNTSSGSAFAGGVRMRSRSVVAAVQVAGRRHERATTASLVVVVLGLALAAGPPMLDRGPAARATSSFLRRARSRSGAHQRGAGPHGGRVEPLILPFST